MKETGKIGYQGMIREGPIEEPPGVDLLFSFGKFLKKSLNFLGTSQKKYYIYPSSMYPFRVLLNVSICREKKILKKYLGFN